MSSSDNRLSTASRDLVETASDRSSSPAAMQRAMQRFLEAARNASSGDVTTALGFVAGYLDRVDLQQGAGLALACGALVERGADPAPLVGPLTARLATLLEAAAALMDACRERLPERFSTAVEDDADDSDGNDADDEDPDAVVERTLQELDAVMPDEAAAWHALKRFWPAGIAVFSASAQARAEAQHLRGPAGRIAEHHEAGHWLKKILTVLDDEPIVAIEPSTSTGILGRISGVVDNFQLNTLLMDGLPRKGFFARRRVAQRIADTARGKGSQQTNETVTSVWNLYTWKAVRPDLTLPDPSDYGTNTHWIWNEGAPEDIPLFEDRRAILLGPPSYPRSWPNQRMFNLLKADLSIDRTLTSGEVRDWLTRMAAGRSSD